MQDKVVFKLGVVDEKVKIKAMKIVCEFSGVTSLNVKEKGKLKVTGEFDKFIMMKKLKKIYQYIDRVAVGPDKEPVQNRNPVQNPKPRVTKPSLNGHGKKGPSQNRDGCLIM